MIGALAQKIFGSANDRYLKRLDPHVEAINALEPSLEALSDDEIRGRTAWLRERLANGEELDNILQDAFATVREAAKRTLGQRHFDVQLLGGIVLHQGTISEMKTGEGKTLVATLPVYLNALSGKGVHVVTVNDYLAERDADRSTGSKKASLSDCKRRSSPLETPCTLAPKSAAGACPVVTMR